MNNVTFGLNDIVEMKKQHPCGSKEWEILRVGADFRLKCMGCGHQIMIARRLLEKNVKEVKAKVPYYLTYLYSYRIHSDSKFKTDRGKPYYNP